MQPAPQPPAEPWRKRLLNMRELVGKFDAHAPIPWAIEPFAIPGTLAVIAGQGGSGKTWVMHEAAHAFATGRSDAGFQATPGKALIIDAEMGEWLTVQRFAQQGYSLDIDVLDATGLNLKQDADRTELWSAIVALGPAFIAWDSLAALTAGADENGKETGDLLNWVRVVHQKTNAAGLMIHHAGWKEERTRGSSTIRDRCDAVWYMRQSPDDEDVRELYCTGAALKAPRWSRPPATRYMRLRESGGLVATDKPEAAVEVKQKTREQQVREAIAAGSKLTNLGDVAEAAGYSRASTVQGKQLLERLGLHKVDGVYAMNGNAPAI